MIPSALEENPAPSSNVWFHRAITVIVFLIGIYAVPRLLSAVIPGPRGYPHAAMVKTIQIGIALLAVALVHRIGIMRAAVELGLGGSFGRALLVALIAVLPMFLAVVLVGSFRSDMSLLVFSVTGLFSPVAEEVFFRGYAFGQLYRRGQWSFWLAVLVPTICFSLGHLYQSTDAFTTLGVLGVTAAGSVWFAWLYARWGNLWVPIAIHALMNLTWYVFTVDQTAIGGWSANIARSLTIVVSVLLTVFRDRIWSREIVKNAKAANTP